MLSSILHAVIQRTREGIRISKQAQVMLLLLSMNYILGPVLQVYFETIDFSVQQR